MFICLEGIDGAGKTTVARIITDRLSSDRRLVKFVKHNSVLAGTPYVSAQLENLRNIQLEAHRSPYGELCDLHWILLRASYYAIVDQHILSPALAAGQLAIADGWFYKFVARIASGQSHKLPDVLKYFGEIRTPDIGFLLDVEPSLAARRRGDFNAGELGPANTGTDKPTEAFISYQSIVRSHLVGIARSKGWPVLAVSNMTVTQVANQILSHLHDTLRQQQTVRGCARG